MKRIVQGLLLVVAVMTQLGCTWAETYRDYPPAWKAVAISTRMPITYLNSGFPARAGTVLGRVIQECD